MVAAAVLLALQVYVNVLKRAKDAGIRLTDHYTLPRT
jgi:hypothetical protein